MTNKVKAMEKVTAHFRNKISGEAKSITVPEWDNLTIYYKTSNTLEAEGRLVELAQKGKTIEALVETLITKAMDEEGKPLFTKMDKTTFMHEADPSVVIRIVGEMNSANLDTNLEIVEKN